LWGTFSPDGKTITTCDSFAVRTWNAATGNLVGQGQSLQNLGLGQAVLSRDSKMRFSPDSKTIVTAQGTERTAQVWDALTGHAGKTFQHEAPIKWVAFSPDGKILLTAGERTVRLWDVATGKQVAPTLQHPEPLDAVAFSPDGSAVLTGCADRSARL